MGEGIEENGVDIGKAKQALGTKSTNIYFRGKAVTVVLSLLHKVCKDIIMITEIFAVRLESGVGPFDGFVRALNTESNSFGPVCSKNWNDLSVNIALIFFISNPD